MKKEFDYSELRANRDPSTLFQLWGIYRDYMVHEDHLIDGRLQRMLAIQGFLFGAFGLTLTEFWKSIPSFTKACAGDPAGFLLRFEASELFCYVSLALFVALTGGLSSWVSRRAIKPAEIARKTLKERWVTIAGGLGGRGDELGLPGLSGGGSDEAFRLGEGHLKYLPWYFIGFWIIAGAIFLWELGEILWQCR